MSKDTSDVPTFQMDIAPEPGRAVIRVVGQTLLAIIVPHVFVGTIDSQGGTFDPLVWKWDWFENICIRAACWGFPLLVGAAAGQLGTKSLAAARRVWIVPTALWTFGCFWNAADSFSWNIWRSVRDLLSQERDPEGIGLFITYTAWSCLGYSIGAILGSRVVLRFSRSKRQAC